jgi:hypothetical protein
MFRVIANTRTEGTQIVYETSNGLLATWIAWATSLAHPSAQVHSMGAGGRVLEEWINGRRIAPGSVLP